MQGKPKLSFGWVGRSFPFRSLPLSLRSLLTTELKGSRKGFAIALSAQVSTLVGHVPLWAASVRPQGTVLVGERCGNWEARQGQSTALCCGLPVVHGGRDFYNAALDAQDGERERKGLASGKLLCFEGVAMNINTNLDLRDHIAITAMEAALRTEQALSTKINSSASPLGMWSSDPRNLASFCYRLADAMLAAREAPTGKAVEEAGHLTPEGKATADRLRRLAEAQRKLDSR